MMATTPRELPELPPSLDEVSVFMGARSDEFSRFAAPNDEYFSAADMHAYARQAIAESEARAEDARDAARYRWLRNKALDPVACMDRGDRFEPWCVIGNSAKDSGPCDGDDLDAAIDAAIAQEAEREAGSA